MDGDLERRVLWLEYQSIHLRDLERRAAALEQALGQAWTRPRGEREPPPPPCNGTVTITVESQCYFNNRFRGVVGATVTIEDVDGEIGSDETNEFGRVTIPFSLEADEAPRAVTVTIEHERFATKVVTTRELVCGNLFWSGADFALSPNDDHVCATFDCTLEGDDELACILPLNKTLHLTDSTLGAAATLTWDEANCRYEGLATINFGGCASGSPLCDPVNGLEVTYRYVSGTWRITVLTPMTAGCPDSGGTLTQAFTAILGTRNCPPTFLAAGTFTGLTSRLYCAQATTTETARCEGDAVSDSSVGVQVWADPGQAWDCDPDTYASVAPLGGAITQRLKLTNAAIGIPGSPTIVGIKVEIDCEQSTGDDDANFNEVRLFQAGSLVGDNLGAATAVPKTRQVVTFGGPTSLWGATWAAADINHSGFGVGIRVANVPTEEDLSGVRIHGVTITVYHSAAGVGGATTITLTE